MDNQNFSVILSVLGKLLYTYPDAAFLSSIKEGMLFDSFPYQGEDAAFARGLALLKEWQASDGLYDECISDFQDLFIGVRDRVKVPAWESIYVSPEPMMFGECTLKVRLWYDRYGLEIKNIRHEPDDHMGVELMFLGYLMKENPLDACRFFKEHIGLWYDKFFIAMATASCSSLYKGLAFTLHSLCADIEKNIAVNV